jgi:phosphatidylinositol-3-phosphatase
VKQFIVRTLPLTLLLTFSALAVAQVPRSNHVVIVVEENHSLSQVIGNPAMPYFNFLARSYAQASQMYANTHPSIGNYFELTTGQIITNNDATNATVSADNIVRHLLTLGKTWKGYAENLPAVGYVGGDVFPYARHHFPVSYFSDVVNSRVQRLNLVPFSHFPSDLANNHLPDFSLVIPNIQDDAHNCPAGLVTCTDAQELAAADHWLKQHIAPLIANPAFKTDGILIILFDEGNFSDTAHGGGHIATIVIGPKVRRGFKSKVFYQHQNVLRTILVALGARTFPGAASSAVSMADVFHP